MKKNNESSNCPITKDCRSSLIGSVLALIISVLLWLQSLGCKDCQKLDGRNTEELSEALEKLKQFADQSQIMADEVCKTCCQHLDTDSESRKQVTFAELDPALCKQTQTEVVDIKDTATQPDPSFIAEKEVQNSAECRCEITQKSTTQIRDEKNQCNIGACEKSVQVQADKVQVEPLKAKSCCECEVRKRESLNVVNAEIAEVYRSLVSDEVDIDDEEEEEEEGEEMLMDPAQYQCPQICTPYPSQQRAPPPPQPYGRPLTPYDRREQVSKRSEQRQPSYPRYDPNMYNRQQFQYQQLPPSGPMYTAPAGYPHLRPSGYQKPNSYAKAAPLTTAQSQRAQYPCAPRQVAQPTPRCAPAQAGQSPSRQRSPMKSTSPARDCVKECPGIIKPPTPMYQEYITECLPDCQNQRTKSPTRQRSPEDCTYCTPKCMGTDCQPPPKPVQKQPSQPQEPTRKVSISTPTECKLHCPGSQHRPPIALMPKGAIPVVPTDAAEFDVHKAIAPPPETASYMSVENPEK